MNSDNDDLALSAYARPEALIATKTTSLSTRRFEGTDADLRHDVWFVCTDDPTKKRYPERGLLFDQVVDVGAVRLNAADHAPIGLPQRFGLLRQ